MPYATRQDLIDRFGVEEMTQLTDRDGSGTLDPALLDRALATADGLIDGYLAGRYALPLDPVPAPLAVIAADLARYELYDDAVPDLVRDRRDAAIARLKDLAAGRWLLPTPPEAHAAPGRPTVAGRPAVFGPATLDAAHPLVRSCGWGSLRTRIR